jgi:hypothetical protein
MGAIDILTAIGGTSSLATLEAFSRSLWADWAAGRITDDQTQSLAETIEARRREVRGRDRVAVRAPEIAMAAKMAGRPSHFPPRRPQPVSPDRRISLERRRRLAASGPMPPMLASRFTTGELAALRIVSDEIRERGTCRLTLGEIAARAGIGVTTARNALRYAARDGLVTIEERRRDKRPNLPNVVRIVSREWSLWLARSKNRPGGPSTGGSKKPESTDRVSHRNSYRDRTSRGRHSKNSGHGPPRGGTRPPS